MYLNYKGLCRAEEVRGQLRKMLINAKVPLISCEGKYKKQLNIDERFIHVTTNNQNQNKFPCFIVYSFIINYIFKNIH